MDAARQLIRYSIPGGVFAVFLVLFTLIFHALWRTKTAVTFFVVTDNGFATAAGIVIVGFVIYQIYYAMHQPVVRFPLPRIKLGRTYDRAGWVLCGLNDVDGFLERIMKIQGIVGPLQYLDRYYDYPKKKKRGKLATVYFVVKNHTGDKHYTEQWYRNVHAMRSLINVTTVDGQTRIKDDYVALGDIYHALGACRISVTMGLIATGVQYGIVDYSQYATRLSASIVATALCLIAGLFMLRIIQHNRKDTLHTMTWQLRRDLRTWITQNPDFLRPHEDEPGSDGALLVSVE